MEDWNRIKEAVADALELPVSERARFLADLDVDIAERVGALVGASGPVNEQERLPELGLGPPALDWTHEAIGGYRVTRFLARGGMGEVFEAEQAGTGRRVALKVLARSTHRDRSRFQQEGRLLGQLSHKNIASVLDADVHRAADGSRWPYLALELVDGERITDHVRHAQLGRADILRLFCDVCRGVEHAHRKGIVHRDLKPDNILVAPGAEEDGGIGQPKILDFGIAALDAETADGEATRLTQEGDLIGTLAYMAPEQLDGGQVGVDVRTDVYGLGVVLFELLTGRLPFDLTGRTLTECLQLLRGGHAELPSTFDRSLRGDLDTIIATALATDRARRYPSAQALSQDIERHLAHQPIAARPAGRLYRAAKFVQRHRALVGGTLLAGALLGAGVVGTSIGLSRARAEVLHNQDVNAFLGEILASPSPDDMGGDVSLREVLDRFAPQIEDRFPDHPLTRSQLHARVGWAFLELSEGERALHHLERTFALCEQELGAADRNTLRAERELVHARHRFGTEGPDALEEARELSERIDAILGERSVDGLLARTHYGLMLGSASRLEESCDVIEQALKLAEGAEGAFTWRHRETVYNAQAYALTQLGRYDEALEIYAELGELCRRELGPEAAGTLRNGLNFVSTLAELGRLEEALTAWAELEAPMGSRFGADTVEAAQFEHARAVIHMGYGEYDEAVELFAATLEVYEGGLGASHSKTLLTLNNLAVCQAYRERWDLCQPLLDTLIERADGLDDDDGVALSARGLRAAALSNQGRFEEAREQEQELIVAYTEVYGPKHPRTLIERNNLARILHTKLEQPAAGARILEEVVTSWGEALPDDVGTRRTLLWNLGRAQADAGEHAAAEATLLEVHALEDEDPSQAVGTDAWRARMHDLYLAWGRPEAASEFAPAGSTDG